jgi:CheY-like chemotaxis protein
VSVLVLVVDDEPDADSVTVSSRPACATLGHGLARSAADALSLIADPIEQTLILILSDINLPGMTGLEMLPKVREMRPEVPMIMITAYGDPETKRKATEGGVSD